MLALLPFQFSWAAVAVYCQHEQEQSTHFGHHTHEHQAQANEQIDDSGDPRQLMSDSDCAVCHLSGQPSFFVDLPTVTPPNGQAHSSLHQAYYSSHIPDGPQKPDWHLVA